MTLPAGVTYLEERMVDAAGLADGAHVIYYAPGVLIDIVRAQSGVARNVIHWRPKSPPKTSPEVWNSIVYVTWLVEPDSPFVETIDRFIAAAMLVNDYELVTTILLEPLGV